MQNNHKEKSLVKWGFLSILVASACCWLPLLLISFGVINISTALAWGYRSGYFLATGLTLTGLAIYFYWCKNGKSCCTTKSEYKRQIIITIIFLVTVLAAAYFIKHYIVPYLAPIIYEQSFNK